MKNRSLLAFIAGVVIVSLIIFLKTSTSKSTYVYANVKVGQGLWWASTSQPPLWLLTALKNEVGKKEIRAQLLSLNYYPYFIVNLGTLTSQYNLYLTVRLNASFNEKDKKYYFDRSPLEVASPIDLELGSVQLSGTVTEINDKPFNEIFEEKTVYLSKKMADDSEYQNITVGDGFFDGQQEIINILSKDLSGDNAVIKTKMKLKKINGQYVLGQEDVIVTNKILNFTTAKMVYYGFLIDKIE